MSEERAFTFVRHGQTDYNRRGLVNGDPSIPVGLDHLGVAQCLALRATLAGIPFDLGIHTRFMRTAESLALILDGRDVPTDVYPELDDVRLGDFEGRSVADYRAWRHTHPPEEHPPGEGESRIAVLYRYVRGLERLLEDERAGEVLAVVHDIPIRFLANALLGADPLDGPVHGVANGEVHRVRELELRAALAVMRDRVGE